MKIAAVVVWFCPNSIHLGNLSALNHCDRIWVIDNSPTEQSSWLLSVPNVRYHWLGGNRGIANALNTGCQAAQDECYDFILTMDQDTFFDPNELERHIILGAELFKDASVAIISAAYGSRTQAKSKAVEECMSVITSGNLLRLSAWRKIKKFNESLFIDEVDHEFCYRLRREGYRVVTNSRISMHHKIGEPVTGIFFGRTITSTNHSWIRRYYQSRNSLYLRRHYPEYVKPLRLYLRDLRDIWMGIILLEGNVCLKIYAALLGYWDHYRRRYGMRDFKAHQKKL